MLTFLTIFYGNLSSSSPVQTAQSGSPKIGSKERGTQFLSEPSNKGNTRVTPFEYKAPWLCEPGLYSLSDELSQAALGHLLMSQGHS